MFGFSAAQALSAARHLLHPAARSIPSDAYVQTIYISSMKFVTRAKLRERQSLRDSDSDDELAWYHRADRYVPWPGKQRRDEEDKEDKTKKKNNGRRSFKLRCEKYLKPFTLDIFISNRFVHATIMHRALHKVVAVANSNAKEFRGKMPAYGDIRACWVIGKVLADRAKEADVYTVVYEPRRGEKMDNRRMTIVETLVENGIALELEKN